MGKIKYSILVCAYANYDQFGNFLWTACSQDFDRSEYEIIVVDNASPLKKIKNICDELSYRHRGINYLRIGEEDKKCRTIAQGINLAAQSSFGEYLIIVADSNVLLSFNLISEIDNVEFKNQKILLSGRGSDIKISPDGRYETEYKEGDSKEIWRANCSLLQDMGWPNDPLALRLINGKFRLPKPHNDFDVYVAAMNKAIFFEGPYNENSLTWGSYHSDFVKQKSARYSREYLKNIRVIHQFHRVWKNNESDA